MDEAPIERDSMELDVVIVGAGPSGLAAARLRQLPEGRAMPSAYTPPERVMVGLHSIHSIHGITLSARGL